MSADMKSLEIIPRLQLPPGKDGQVSPKKELFVQRMETVLNEISIYSTDPEVSVEEFAKLEIEREMISHLLSGNGCVAHRMRAARRYSAKTIVEVAERVISLLIGFPFKFATPPAASL